MIFSRVEARFNVTCVKLVQPVVEVPHPDHLVATKCPVPVSGVIDFQTPADELLLQACHDLLVILIPSVHFSLVGSKMGAHKAQGSVVEVKPDCHSSLIQPKL